MSATSFINLPDVFKKLAKTFPDFPPQYQGRILVKPKTRQYSLTGTAFDYLLRFYIKRLNKNSIDRPWIAERAPLFIAAMIEFNPDTQLEKTRKEVKRIITNAKRSYNRYLTKEILTTTLIVSSIRLAQVDPIVRNPSILTKTPLMLSGNINSLLIRELRGLLQVASKEFDTKLLSGRSCYLNPNFGEASIEIGGADADLIIGDTLIDIKTTKHAEVTDQNYNQLLCYYTLSKLGKINNEYDVPITNLGIYFSRYGKLFTFPAPHLLPHYISWFKTNYHRGSE